MAPDLHGLLARPNLRDGIIHKILLDAADMSQHPPFADAVHIDTFWKQIEHLVLEKRVVLVLKTAPPSPIVANHLGVGRDGVHPSLHCADDIGYYLLGSNLAAIRAI